MIKGISGITRRGKGYLFTVALGRDGNYKVIRKFLTYIAPNGVSTEVADTLAVEEYLVFKQSCKGNKSLNENMRFSSLCEDYFKTYAPNCLKESTVYNYTTTCKNHLIPKFGNYKLKDITTADISEFLTTMTLAPSSTKKTKIVIHSILSYAVKQGYIKINPCMGAICKKDDEEKVDNYLTVAQAKQLVAVLQDYSQFNTIIKVLLFTGMRSGECLGLRWNCVDFDKNTIKIDSSLTYANNRWFLTTPKTKSSKRTISIDGEVAKLLRKHKIEQDTAKEIVGDGWQQPQMVFTSCTGHWYDRSLLNTQFRRFIKRQTNIPYITIHGLRHTCASLLICAKEELEVISKQLGHSSISITSLLYSHMLDEVKVRVTKSIASVLM